MSDTKKTMPVTEKNIVDDVLNRVNKFKESGELVLPKDYSAENALKSAYLILSETTNKDNQPVLQACSTISIANALLDMVVQGLSPIKKQCYFIAYGNRLECSRSYLGAIAVARRVGLKYIVANVIYENDAFVYEIDPKTGLKHIVEHTQDLSNIDISKIRGAYTITELEDGMKDLTLMTVSQIKQAWLQGYAKGKSGAHTNFTDEMCKKTVINRACKMIINSSTDVFLTSSDDDDSVETTIEITGEVVQEANKTELKIEAPKQREVVPKKQEAVGEKIEVESPKNGQTLKADF